MRVSPGNWILLVAAAMALRPFPAVAQEAVKPSAVPPVSTGGTATPKGQNRPQAPAPPPDDADETAKPSATPATSTGGPPAPPDDHEQPQAPGSPAPPSGKSAVNAPVLNEKEQKILQAQRSNLLKVETHLREHGKTKEAVSAVRARLAISRKLGGDVSALVASDLAQLGYRQIDADQLDEARHSFEQALRVNTALHGEADYHTADVRRKLEEIALRSRLAPADRQELVKADLAGHWAAEPGVRFADALKHAKRAYDIRKRLLGPEHPLTARSLRRLGEAHEDLSQYAEAQKCLEESVRIRRKILGDAHPDTASSLLTLGHLKERQHDYAKAEEYYRQALEILAKVQDENAEAGDNWFKIAKFHYRNPNRQGKSNYELALMASRHSVEIREAVLGPNHHRTADSLHVLGLCEYSLGHPTKAKEALARALSIYKAQSEDMTELIVTATTDLANAERVLGDAAHAEAHYREVLNNRRKLFGEQDARTGAAYSNLGSFYSTRGLYEQAEPLLQQAIDIDAKISGKDRVHTAVLMAELARLYLHLGDEAKAESLYRKALAIERKLRPRGLQSARLMGQLAALYTTRRDLRRAEPLCLESLAIKRLTLPEESAELHASLERLATIYTAKKEFAKARELLDVVLASEQKTFGKVHPNIATLLFQQAQLAHATGDDARAVQLYSSELGICKQIWPGDHPETARSLYDVGLELHYLGDDSRAKPKLQEALEMGQRLLKQHFGVLAERQQLALEQRQRRFLDAYLSATDDPQSSAAEAYRFVLAAKGAVTASQSFTRLERRRPELKPLADELLEVGTRLAHLSFSTPQPKHRKVWLKEISDLTDRKDRLERDLTEKSARFRQSRQTLSVDPDQLRKAIEPATALVDILYYRHYFPRKAGEKSPRRSEDRYVAFIVRRDAPIQRVELGDNRTIVADFRRWRQNYATETSETPEVAEVARRVRDRVWKPLEPYLTGAQTVFVSPDEAFCWFPLAALPGSRPNSYLIEERNIVFVPVPQMLLGPGAGRSRRHGTHSDVPLLLGNVDFDADSGNAFLASRGEAAWNGQTRPAERGVGTAQNVFVPLPSTAAEIDDIAEIYRQTFKGREPIRLTGADAKEQTVRKEAPKHRWIHLATHGFFARATVRSARTNRQGSGERILGRVVDSVEELRGVHPGLMSGVALAGANRHWQKGDLPASPSDKEPDDGILTALDVEGLNLADVDLVVLSACETGLGQLAGGEGALGLQRAFQVAGAKHVVSSLWKVNDNATAALMRLFYRNLWVERLPPADALRQAQLTLLHHPEMCDAASRSRGPNFDKVIPFVERKSAAPAAASAAAAPTASPRLWAAFILSQSTFSSADAGP